MERKSVLDASLKIGALNSLTTPLPLRISVTLIRPVLSPVVMEIASVETTGLPDRSVPMEIRKGVALLG